MFTPHRPSLLRPARRGVVLILVLAMLSILALLGVTFATLTGQAKIGAEYRTRALNNPEPTAIFDFALNQIINDTNNPKSAIRGHSLLRDMYGNDGASNGYFGKMPAPYGWPFYVVSSSVTPVTVNGVACTQYQITTNIPTNTNPMISFCPDLYNASFGPVPSTSGTYFSGWTLRLQQWFLNTQYADSSNRRPGTRIYPVITPLLVTRTMEVVWDDTSTNWHVLTLSPIPNTQLATGGVLPDTGPTTPPSTLTSYYSSVGSVNIFELDGRYQRSFNGSGMSNGGNFSSSVTTTAIPPDRPNFLYNNPFNSATATYAPDASGSFGYNEPNTVGMDEDYDAVDGENLFLALQTADGSIAIPSFHRPSTIVYDSTNPTLPANNDWLNTGTTLLDNTRRAKMFRPRAVDHPAAGKSTFPDLIPDATSGKVTYDVDNDGDGVTDSVWIDLGYPVQRDATGKAYKPLFAITIIGLNGRLPLNTAGNLQLRNWSTGQPLFDHVSHVGYSPFEVNPKYALTNLTVAADATAWLKHVLAGNADAAGNQTTGRYGEREAVVNDASYAGLPAAGYSHVNGITSFIDYFDSNFNATDFHPNYVYDPTTGVGTFPEGGNLIDNAGYPKLPSERFRNFVYPQDITGNGFMMEFDQTPNTSQSNPTVSGYSSITDAITGARSYVYGLGGDKWGRHSFFMYFRPPGADQTIIPSSTDGGGNTVWETKNSHLNKYHGYEYHRNPAGDPANVTGSVNHEFMARAPFDPTLLNFGNAANTTVPTFGSPITSTNPGTLVAGQYPGGSLALSEDAQLNLYGETPYDEPYTAADLEWLYRYDPAAKQSLQSRLGTLLNINQGANQQVARLFSIDSWEPIHYAWYQNVFNAIVVGSPSTGIGNTDNTPTLASAGRKINLNYPVPLSNDPDEPKRQKWCQETYQVLKQVLYTARGITPTAVECAQLGQWVVNVMDFRDPDATMTRFYNPDVILVAGTTTLPAHVTLSFGNGHNADGSGQLIQWGMEYQPVALNEVLAYQFTTSLQNPPPNGTPINKAQVQRLFVELVSTLVEDANGANDNGGTASELDLNGWGFVITSDNIASPPSTCPGERPNSVTGQLSYSTIQSHFIPIDATNGYLSNKVEALQTHSSAVSNTSDPLPNQGSGNEYYLLGNSISALTGAGGKPIESSAPTTNATLSDTLVQKLPLYTTGSGTSNYFWLHLLRPANPNLAASSPPTPDPTQLVVVDSIRFPYSECGGAVDTSSTPETVTAPSAPSNPIYAVGRSQPYRGGHAVPGSEAYYPSGAPSLSETLPFPYGYSEQCSGQFDNSGEIVNYYIKHDPMAAAPNDYQQVQITTKAYHTLGDKNQFTEPWDLFLFNDRDFNSVAELLLVPGAPPGLFTKQFVEQIGLPYTLAAPPRAVHPFGCNRLPTVSGATPPELFVYQFDTSGAGPDDTPYPYATPPTSLYADNTPAHRTDPTSGSYAILPPVQRLNVPRAYPYLPNNFYYTGINTSTTDDAQQSTVAGWYAMLEFFEVPSPAAGAIGPVAQGDNGDWLRNEVKPGLINLNLIYDEEVFFGLVDDPRLNASAAVSSTTLPQIVTAINAMGNPSASYTMANRGFMSTGGASGQMKAAFCDFLKLRHGGSGYIGLFNSPYYLSGNANYAGNVYPEKPYHALSAYAGTGGLSINDTLMRPARLSAVSDVTAPNIYKTPQSLWIDQMPTSVFQDTNSKQIEVLRTAVPPRMLFQIGDTDQHPPAADSTNNSQFIDSPASDSGTAISYNSATSAYVTTTYTGDHSTLANTFAELFVNSGAPYQLGSASPNIVLAGESNAANVDPNSRFFDRRQHPYFRTELMQKMMNLSTVRTHQFACWITVGFFEVVEEGNPQILITPAGKLNPFGAIDQLGKELGAAEGKSNRYQLFCVIDRSRADGFNPYEPKDFNNYVVYSNRIK